MTHQAKTNPLVLRASSIGGCPRAYVMSIRSGKEWEPSPIQKTIFAIGKALEPVIMEAAGLDPATLFNDQTEVKVTVSPDLTIVGHPDSECGDLVVECKTMKSFAFKMLSEKGHIQQIPQYLCQGAIYSYGLKKEGVRYLVLNKDTAELFDFVVFNSALLPFLNKAIDNAILIQRWVDKEKLPSKPDDLPFWYCLEKWCRWPECRFHMSNRRGKTWPKKKVSVDMAPEKCDNEVSREADSLSGVNKFEGF